MPKSISLRNPAPDNLRPIDADAVLARFPETLVSNTGPKKAGRVQAWVTGPGAGDDPAWRLTPLAPTRRNSTSMPATRRAASCGDVPRG